MSTLEGGGRATPDEQGDERPSKRAARSTEMRQRLLDAAEALYAVDGARALTNRRISDAAGTTTQAIYTYYGSRDALLDAMYQRAVDGAEEILSLADAVTPVEPDESEIAEAFKEAARQYRAFCLTHPARFRLIRGTTDDDVSENGDELRVRLVEAIATFGRPGSDTPTELYEARIHMTIAALHGFFQAELDGFITGAHDPDRLFDELVHRCLAPFDQLPTSW